MENIYLDNAATSHPKPEAVYHAVDETLRGGGSAGRGSHQQALSAERILLDLREACADIFNAPDCDRFVFSSNATAAINQALFGLLREGDRVVTTMMEHNAVARPLRILEQRGVEVVKVAADQQGVVAVEKLKAACLKAQTRLLVICHCSNVSGTLQAIEAIGPWCRQQGIVFMVDAAQSAGAYPIDVQAMAIDLLTAPGHKRLLGPQGTGVLYIDPSLQLEPLLYGGTGTYSAEDFQPDFLPEALEVGTSNIVGLAGLLAGLKYIQSVGVEAIRAQDQAITSRLLSALSMVKGVNLYGPDDVTRRGEVVSLNIDGYDAAEVGFLLEHQWHIAVRVGLHCAPDAHRSIGTFPQGTVRVSPGHFTTEEEINLFIAAITSIAAQRI